MTIRVKIESTILVNSNLRNITVGSFDVIGSMSDHMIATNHLIFLNGGFNQTLVYALGRRQPEFKEESMSIQKVIIMSRDMRFPTMWYVQSA